MDLRNVYFAMRLGKDASLDCTVLRSEVILVFKIPHTSYPLMLYSTYSGSSNFVKEV